MPNLDEQRSRFDADPGEDRSFTALEENLYLSGNWEELIRLYEQRLRAPRVQSTPRMRAELHFRLGQVWEERIGQIARAQECYRNTLAADPAYRPALQRLRELHTASGQWDVALQLAELEVGLPLRRDERAELLAEIGLLWLDRAGDPAQALSYFKQSLTEVDHCARALEGTWRAFERSGQPGKAERALEHLIGQRRGSDRAALRVEQARLLAGPLGQRDRAFDAYRRALSDDPSHPVALEAVAEGAVARAQWELVADLAERRFQRADTRERKLAIAREAARVHGVELASEAAEQLWLRRGLELDPSDAGICERLAELAGRAGNHAERLRHLEHAIELRGTETPNPILVEVAEHFSAVGEPARALPLLEHALARSPEDARTLEQLSNALVALERFEALADVLERRAVLVTLPADARAAILGELGQLALTRLGDEDAALAAWERAFALAPERRGVCERIEALLQKRGHREALRSFYENAIRSGPASERARLAVGLGNLLSTDASQLESAQRYFESALALAPDLPAAHAGLQQVALQRGDGDALERALVREASATNDRARLRHLTRELARMGEARGDLAGALHWISRWSAAEPEDTEALHESARLQEALGQPVALLATLERLDPLLSGVEQAANRRRIARSRLGSGQDAQAAEAFESALRSYPRDIESLRALVALHERAHRPAERVRALERLAELLPPAERAECLAVQAELESDSLGDLSAAIETWRRLEGSEQAPHDLAKRIAALLQRSGRFEELALHLSRAIEASAPRDPARLELGLERALLLLDSLGRAGEAVDACEALLAMAPEHEGVEALLERALRAAGDPLRLADCLGRRARRDSDAARAAQALRERALLLEEQVGDFERARATWAELAERSTALPLRCEASAHIADLLERDGLDAALRDHLEGALARAEVSDPVAAHEKLASLCRRTQRDPLSAVAHLEAAAALAPTQGRLFAQLSDLYAEAGREADLIRCLEGEIAAHPDPEREVTLRCRAAQLCAEVLVDPERACRHAERALALAPGHPFASDLVLRHWERSGEPALVLGLLEDRLRRLLREPAERAESAERAAELSSLRLRIAGLRANALSDLDGAIAALEPALDANGANALVAEPLADLYQRAGYGEDLIELCRSAALASVDPAERHAWQLRLADTLRERNQDLEAADAYERVLAERPGDLEAQAALRAICRRLARSERLAALLDQQLARLSGPEEIPARLELAALRETSRPADALAELRRVLELDPSCREALDRALVLGEALGKPGVQIELIDRALLREPPDRGALLLRRARLLAKRNREQAIASYRAAAALRPSDRELCRELRECLSEARDAAAALECLEREIALAAPAEREALLETAVEVAARGVAPDASLPWLERLHRARPRDTSVLRRMAALHRAAGRRELLLACLEREAALPGDDARRRELANERAEILDAAGFPGRAATVLEECRRSGAADAAVCQRLEQLNGRLGRAREQVDAIAALIEKSPANDHTALAQKAAALCEDRLRDPVRAAHFWQLAVLGAAPGSSQRADLLRRQGLALRRAGPPATWARCAEAELAELDPEAPVFADRRSELHAALAKCYERELLRPDLALRQLRALLDSNAGSASIDTSRVDAAEADLLRLLRASDAAGELATRLAGSLARKPRDPEGWLELARLREERLCDLPGAVAAYRRLLELEPDCLPALRGLRGCAERLGDHEQVAASLQRELDHPQTTTGIARAALFRRMGDLHWRRLASTTRASRCYASALEANPRDFEALRSLEELLLAMEDWRGSAELFESEIEVLGQAEPERRSEIWLRVASLARDQLSDPERAQRALARAAEIAALPAPRQLELAQLQRRLGDAAGFAAAYQIYCEHPDAPARGSDWLELADACFEIGEHARALAAAERALALEPELPLAHELVARVREAAGDRRGARVSLESAARRAPDADAAQFLLRASDLSDEPEHALSLLRSAAERDAGSLAVAAALARRAGELGQHALAREHAERALQLSAPGSGADAPALRALRLAAALAGGASALAKADFEAAARCYSVALSVDPDHPQALAGYGEALAALGDLPGARFALEPLISREGSYPGRGRHRVLVAQSLVAAGDRGAAVRQLEAAIADEPALDAAHSSLIELHREAGDLGSGVRALERWADQAFSPALRAQRLLDAARWELAQRSQAPENAATANQTELADAAERHLREILEAAPDCAEAWISLTELLWQCERRDDAFELATRALASIETPRERGALALVQARALEHKQQRREAAEAYALAANSDPRCCEAALALARILRGLGEWREAADALQRFAERHPGDAPDALAEILQQRGRLLAGPLEDVDAAVATYRRALALVPAREDLHAALAELLSHQPRCADEARDEIRALLDRNPTQPALLRIGLRLARYAPEAAPANDGLRILAALGIATPDEQQQLQSASTRPRFARARALETPRFEQARLLADACRDEIGSVLGGAAALARPATGALSSFRNAIAAIEAELVPPPLASLPGARVAELLSLFAALSLDPERVRGDGALVNAASAALGRRARKRIRPLLEHCRPEDLAALDVGAWRREIRALACLRAIDAGHGDLRSALLLELCESSERTLSDFAASDDISALVAEHSAASALLRRAVSGWLAGLRA